MVIAPHVVLEEQVDLVQVVGQIWVVVGGDWMDNVEAIVGVCLDILVGSFEIATVIGIETEGEDWGELTVCSSIAEKKATIEIVYFGNTAGSLVR